MRHAKTVNLKMGPVKDPHRGRPVLDRPVEGPDCKVCRRLVCGPRGGVTCAKGHAVGSAESCGDYSNASRQRYELGGITGRMFAR